MASGIAVKDDCVNVFNELKLKSTHRYITYKIGDDLKEIVVDQIGPRSATWDDFRNALPRDEPRYGVFDLEFSLGDSGDRHKLVLVSWVPETSQIKKKMLYSTSKSALKPKLVGVLDREVQATEMSDLDHAEVIKKYK